MLVLEDFSDRILWIRKERRRKVSLHNNQHTKHLYTEKEFQLFLMLSSNAPWCKWHLVFPLRSINNWFILGMSGMSAPRAGTHRASSSSQRTNRIRLRKSGHLPYTLHLVASNAVLLVWCVSTCYVGHTNDKYHCSIHCLWIVYILAYCYAKNNNGLAQHSQ